MKQFQYILAAWLSAVACVLVLFAAVNIWETLP